MEPLRLSRELQEIILYIVVVRYEATGRLILGGAAVGASARLWCRLWGWGIARVPQASVWDLGTVDRVPRRPWRWLRDARRDHPIHYIARHEAIRRLILVICVFRAAVRTYAVASAFIVGSQSMPRAPASDTLHKAARTDTTGSDRWTLTHYSTKAGSKQSSETSTVTFSNPNRLRNQTLPN